MPENRLPGPESFAVCHLYAACCRLCDALSEPGTDESMEGDEYRAMIFAVRMIATNLESGIKLHSMARKAEQKFIKRLIQLDREEHDCGFLRFDTIQVVTVPSKN